MKAQPVVPREQAHQDVEDVVARDLAEYAKSVALGFINALEKAYGHIGRHPAIGSPRYAHELIDSKPRPNLVLRHLVHGLPPCGQRQLGVLEQRPARQ